MKYLTFLTLMAVSVQLAYPQDTGQNYLDMVDKCLYIENADLRMDIYKKDKIVKYYAMTSFRDGEKMRLEFLQPATERGRRMLNDDSNLWMYLPRTSRVMRLPLKQAFMGSDASNRDLMRLSFKRDYDVIDSEQSGDKVILTLKAKDLSVSYNKVILTIDKQKNIPVKQEMYGLSDKLIKTIQFEKPIVVDGIGFPTTYIIVDNLLKDSKTILTYSNVKRSHSLAAEFFTLGSIKK